MKTTKACGYTTARLEHPNIDETEKKNDLKITLGECLRPLKRNFKKFRQGNGGKYKKMKKSTNPLKKKQGKALKR